MHTLELPDNLQLAVDMRVSGLDIIHGHLKTLMLEAEESLAAAMNEEEKTGEAMDSMTRTYWEGVLDGYGQLYSLTYALSFAIADKERLDNERTK